MTTKLKAKIRLDKPTFFEDLGYTPHEGQVSIHKSKAKRRVVACGVRWGKTLCAAMEGMAAAMESRARSIGWVVAPTYELAEKVFREILVLAVEHLPGRIVLLRNSDRRLVLRNLGGGGSEIRAKSAGNPNSLLGEGLGLLVVGEASRRKPQIWTSYLSQRLIDKKGWALLISTPKGKGWFYDMFRRGRLGEKGFESWNAPSWQNPHLDRSMIEAERERIPERVYLQEYAAEFLEGSGQVFRNVRECATGEFGVVEKNDVSWAGLDLAQVHDHTVICVLNRKGVVVHLDRFNRIDWALQIARIKATCKVYRSYLLVDSTGAGEPVLERLEQAGLAVEGYTLSSPSKAALINNLAIAIEQGEITLPRPELCPELIDELEAFQYVVSESGNVRMEAPSGQHDDCVIALALAQWHRMSGTDRMWFAVERF